MIRIRRIGGPEPGLLTGLGALLQDIVHGGASVGFLAPLAEDTATDYWRRVLDTLSHSDPASVYRHLGWQFAGSIPEYAATPDGVLHATSYFYKQLT